MHRWLIILLFPIMSFAQEKQNVTLLDHWHNDSLLVNSTMVRYNECWGFTRNGQEYAVIGSTEGVHVFLIDEANHLIEKAFVPGLYQHSTVIHRDFKTYGNYLYAVCDEGSSSLQIIDLSYLPDSVHLVAQFPDEIARAHNLTIDSTSALMYVCLPKHMEMGNLVEDRFRIYSIANPVSPVLAWDSPPGFPYVHDCYVRNNIAYLNCGDDGLRVYDFSDPANPVFIQNLNFYQDQGYNHQGWMTPDGTRFVFGDENNGKKLKLCTVDSNHELTIKNYFGTNYQNSSVAHNCMLSDRFAYVAYYNEGLRIYDISGVPREVAYYDTYPDDSPFKMNGAWGVYSDLPSGRVIVSDRQYGLFLFDFNEELFSTSVQDHLILYPNPVQSGDQITLRVDLDIFSGLSYEIFDLNGNLVQSQLIIDDTYTVINANVSKGCYLLKVKYLDYLEEEKTLFRKFIVE